MTRPLLLAACFALAASALPALAQDTAADPAPSPANAAQPANAPLTGDAANGKMLTYTCQGCHGIEGYRNIYPHYHVPRIGGQSRDYLVNALSEYRRGTRRHPTMQAQARSFSEQDIADMAAFLSELTQ